MKKTLLILLLAAVLILGLASCGGECEHTDTNGDFICDKCSDDLSEDENPPECEHKDTDGNLLCDKCGEDLSENENPPECEHEDSDGNLLCDKCGDEIEPPVHTHSYTNKNTDAKYMLEGATCKSGARYCYSCSCGEASEDTFVSGEPLVYHTTKNGSCIVCGARESTAGLALKLNPDGKSYTVTGLGECTVPDVVIGIYNDLSITKIAPYAFSNCLNLASVSIGETVVDIGESAFKDCISLESIAIPKSVKVIGAAAFWNCESLYTVYITDIKAWCEISFESSLANPLAFAESLSVGGEIVTDLRIPDGVSLINNNAFYGYDALERVTIPDSVTEIGAAVFADCPSLEYNEYDNAYYLGNENNPYLLLAGAKSTDITECNIHKDTKLIHSSAFADCTELLGITLPEAVTEINAFVFSGCTSLRSVTVSERLEKIGDSAFAYCEALESFATPSTVREIGSYAFFDCISLGSVTIPESVRVLGEEAFGGCTAPDYNEYDNAYYLGDAQNPYRWLIKAKSNEITECNVHADTKYIYSRAFNGCEYLSAITIPDGVLEIGSYAFAYCHSISSISLPVSVTSVGDYAFEYCNNLESVTLSKRINSIGKGAFSACESLVSITVDAENTDYKSIDGSLYSYDGSVLVQYAVGKLDTQFTVPDSVTKILFAAFHSAKNIETLILPDTVSEIEPNAFFGCEIKHLTAPADFISAFSKAHLLTVSASGKTLKTGTFTGCENLHTVTLLGGIYKIEDFAFSNCASLTAVIIPSSVTHIEPQAFFGCTALSSAEFEKTDGWYRTYYASESSGASISKADLENQATAAQYLKSTYQYYHLKRTDYSILDKLPI